MSMSDSRSGSFSDDLIFLQQRMQWLVGLRWYGIASVFLFAVFGNYILGLHFDLWLMFAITLVMLGYNMYLHQRVNRTPIQASLALQQVVLDVIALTAILFCTGGFGNPFFTFYFFLVIIAWIILPAKQSVAIIALIFVCFALQGIAPRVIEVDMNLSDDGLLYLGDYPFHVVGAPVSFVATTFITAYFVSVIMTDLRKRETELREAQRRSELELAKVDNILRQLDAGMIVLDSQNRVEWVNDRIRHWFGPEGQHSDRATYRVVRACIPDTTPPGQPMLCDEDSASEALQLPTLHDDTRDFELMTTPIEDERGENVQRILLVLDVTEQKRTHEQWARAEKLAAVGQLAAGVAHEINTPLSTIRILAEDALDSIRAAGGSLPGELREDLSEAMQTVYEQTSRCKTITQGLLNVSRMQGRSLESIDLNTVVQQAVELSRHQLRTVTVEETYAQDLPRIDSDSTQIIQVICNLMINARDALEGSANGAHIRVETRRNDGRVEIQVSDNGPGIPRDALSHVFEPFFTTKPVGKGTGLGLYISYAAIRDLGGELDIESEQNIGTTATIWLPVHHE